MTDFNTSNGSPSPLGATCDENGINFALYSESAEAVELCLLDEHDNERHLQITQRTDFVWHIHVAGLKPGQRYAYRVHGPYEPQRGLRFNPNVRLFDPYARAALGSPDHTKGTFAYDVTACEGDLMKSEGQALGAPVAVAVDNAFDWEGDERLGIPFAKSLIYETHVKGLTQLHPEVPQELRGTYEGVCHPAVLGHLKRLGVTAVQLMPVHFFVDDQFLLEKGLRNYWGYNTLGFFAPEPRYRRGQGVGDEVRQFKEMVKQLHRAGFEVILDVVYNHTAEGNHLGPTFCFRGIDNPTYYRLVENDPRYYFDVTGTGNTLNMRHPQTLKLIMDSLRYWVEEMHVDGFRFDLAAALARSLYQVDKLSNFFTAIHQDPTLSQVKLIAEPWDLGQDGYQVGNFPLRWAEWNGRYRDSMRKFWKGEGGVAGELGYRLTGSSDLYQEDGRSPCASINLLTAHDGFTLTDLVSYDEKHNEANGEDNRDGANDNHSFNCGAEGETSDPEVRALRQRQLRNFLSTLFLSQGTPMLLGGDEMGRTQRGNNNAYCQDTELSWYDWHWTDERRSLFEFACKLSELRRSHPVLRRSNFFKGRPIRGRDVTDIAWFRHDGAPMQDEDWSNPITAALTLYLSGHGLDDKDDQGNAIIDSDCLILLNGSHVDLEFMLPQFGSSAAPWQLALDTAEPEAQRTVEAGATQSLLAHSLMVFLRDAES